MIRHTAIWALALMALACTGSLRAHHSIGMFDIATPVWIAGTVVRYEPVNPHAMMELAVPIADGRVQRWTIEGPGSHRLDRILSVDRIDGDQDFLNVGDVIEVCGFAMKEEFRRRRSAREADGSLPPFVHGHVLVRPDGRRHTWGSYGRIENCLRANDQAEWWLEFLNADPLARDFWCRGGMGTPAQAPQALVDEIDGLMSNACRRRAER